MYLTCSVALLFLLGNQRNLKLSGFLCVAM